MFKQSVSPLRAGPRTALYHWDQAKRLPACASHQAQLQTVHILLLRVTRQRWYLAGPNRSNLLTTAQHHRLWFEPRSRPGRLSACQRQIHRRIPPQDGLITITLVPQGLREVNASNSLFATALSTKTRASTTSSRARHAPRKRNASPAQEPRFHDWAFLGDEDIGR